MEQKSTFIRTLEKLESRLQRMNVQLAGVRWFYESGARDVAYEHALELEDNIERAVLLARELPCCTGHPRARSDVEAVMERTIPVEIGFTEEGWFSVRFPALLPRKEKGSKDYIRGILYPAMRRFFEDKAPVRYQSCVLIYRHVYDRERPDRAKRDHDNIEINMVTDIVAAYVLPDDGPDVCDHFYRSADGSAERTEVYIVPRKDFATWLRKEPTMPEEGVRLYETCQFQSDGNM